MSNYIITLNFVVKDKNDDLEDMILVSNGLTKEERINIINRYSYTGETIGNNWIIMPQKTFDIIFKPIFTTCQKYISINKNPSKFKIIYDGSKVNYSINPYNNLPCRILKVNIPNKKDKGIFPITYKIQFDNGEILNGVLKEELKIMFTY